MKLTKYTSRPFPINEQNQARWRLPLPHAEQYRPTTQYSHNDCIDQELDVILEKPKIGSSHNELQENLPHEYLQALGLGKEIRYDLTSITVKFKLLQYKCHPAPIPSFTHRERTALHSVIKQIVMAAELVRAICSGNSDHKYAGLKMEIDEAHFLIYFDKNCHKCKVPVGWIKRNIYRIHTRLTNCHDIITFIDGRHDDVVKMAALQPYLSPYNELRRHRDPRIDFAMRPYATQAGTFTEKSSLHYTPAGIRINISHSASEALLKDLIRSSITFSHYIIADLVDFDYHNTIYDIFKLAIKLNKDN